MDRGQLRKLLMQPARHGIEGGRQLLELIPALDLYRRRKVSLRNPPGALAQLLQRHHGLPDLIHAEQRHAQQRDHDHQAESIVKACQRRKHRASRFTQQHGPGRRRKLVPERDRPITCDIGILFISPFQQGRAASFALPDPLHLQRCRGGRAAEQDLRRWPEHTHGHLRRKRHAAGQVPQIVAVDLSHHGRGIGIGKPDQEQAPGSGVVGRRRQQRFFLAEQRPLRRRYGGNRLQFPEKDTRRAVSRNAGHTREPRCARKRLRRDVTRRCRGDRMVLSADREQFGFQEEEPLVDGHAHGLALLAHPALGLLGKLAGHVAEGHQA